MKRRNIIFLFLIFLYGISAYAIAKNKILFDGFEEIGLWGPATWNVNVGEVRLSQKFVSEGKFSLMVKFDATSQFYKAAVASEEPYDFSNIENLYVDIYNESDGINFFTFAATTGNKWEWHESINYKLMPGWNKNIKIRISGNLWKAERSEMINRVGLRNKSDVRRIVFSFWGSGGKVYIDNIRVDGKSLTKKRREFPGPIKLWESFEKKQLTWQKAGWESKATGVIKSKEKSSDGEYSLRCDFDGITTSKPATFSRDYSVDWTKIKRVYFDIYNDTGIWLKVTFAISTGASWTWYESTPKFLAPGWNKNISFNLNVPKFKTAATKWKNVSYLKFKNAIKRVSINILNTSDKETSGSIYLDNIRLEEGEPFVIKVSAKKPKYYEKIIKNKYTPPKIQDIQINSDTIERYERFESVFLIDSYYNNPFNPEEIDVTAKFYSPSGKVYTVPVFINQDFAEEEKEITPVSDPFWMVRFSPTETGKWKWEIIAKNPAGETKSGKMYLNCIRSGLPGFIRTEKKIFRYDNGLRYIPVGLNVAWVLPEDNWRYTDYINALAQNGVNWMRIWNVTWGKTIIEWGEPEGYGIGKYNLGNCWKIDRIFDAAEQNGINIQFVINYHDMFVEDGIWENNPYNYLEGGPCKKPIEFFTNSYAKKYFKRKLRYIIARWGYSPNLLAWELFNEVDLVTEYKDDIVANWHKEMAEYIKKIGAYKHPVTTSFARVTAGEKVWNLSDIDYVQSHIYTDDIQNAVEKVNEYKSKFNKPHIIGEIGGATTTMESEAKDKEGIRFKEALFSSILSPEGGGTAMYWWWDGYIKKHNLFFLFDALNYFIKDIDFSKDNLKKASVVVDTESMSDLVIAPMLDWEKSLSDRFQITPQGDVIGGLFSKYLQGKYHKEELGGDKIFEVYYPENGKFSVFISTVAKSGAHLIIYVDNKLEFDKEFEANPAGDTLVNQDFTVKIKKGKHTIKIANKGLDWIKFGYLKFHNIVPAISVKGLMNETKGIFWLRNREYTVENYLKGRLPSVIENAKLYIKGFKEGTYYAEIINPDTGKIVAIPSIKVTGKSMKLNLIPMSKDLLLKVNRK